MQPDAALRPLQERPQQPGMVIARIVETDMDHPGSPGITRDHPGVRIGPFQLLEQPQRGFGIDLLALDQGELHRFKVQCAVQVQPLAPCRGLDRRLVGTDEPAMRRPALILGMDRSGEDNRQRRSKISPVGRRKTSPFYVMPKALLRVVPVVHRRDPRGFA